MTHSKAPLGLSLTRLFKVLEWISLLLLPDYLVPGVLCIQRQQACVELKHLSRSGFLLVFGGLFHEHGSLVEGLVFFAKIWGWCVGCRTKPRFPWSSEKPSLSQSGSSQKPSWKLSRQPSWRLSCLC
jgi:hypothetical protein